ncbi:MAG TPA: isocitrate/isopropylmalate dehydrogenase family protein [Planctomycetota bacterium]|jgi:3-isopropylmalate dehydrogenase|nr:3-isopropylmalate dehydrogenase [Planctomycetota bacterium]MDP7246727.1 isocitrate/isopropylmalate dehydrogenase family protein [Planctomycetota bacterium]HJM39164.1 isocitrate/isopropylmalate dehydrogenase family protein [Planctomycetota bacterium]
MAKHKIGWMPGDGVGKEVMDATKTVLDAVGLDAEYTHLDIGWDFWCSDGDPLPPRTIEGLRACDAALFGAITSKPKAEAEAELAPEFQGKGMSYRSPIVRMRQEFDLYSNCRPCKAFDGNPLNFQDGIDLVVFRENTEGMYTGVEWSPVDGPIRSALETHPSFERFQSVPPEKMAFSSRIITWDGSERIVRAAFEYAKEHGYPTVTVVEKPNVLRETSGMFTDAAKAVAKDFPGIELWETNIDAMVMWLVKNPQNYGVIATSNLFGDVVSDLCAQLVGGLGFAAAGNIGKDVAVFEPTHGSAPKYDGQDKVNPIACILASKMMLSFLGEGQKADVVGKAIAKVIAEGKARTYDMGGSTKCSEMGAAIAAAL